MLSIECLMRPLPVVVLDEPIDGRLRLLTGGEGFVPVQQLPAQVR
jgi:hypothetical protein